MQHLNNNKFQLYFFGVMVLIGTILFVIRQLDLNRIEMDGVYVLGYVAETTPTKSGITYTCYYKYNSISYKVHFKAINKDLTKDDLLFFKISSSKPSAHIDLPDIKVPTCINLNKAPDKGWKQLPKCP